MLVTRKEIFVLEGKEFSSLRAVHEYMQNRIGAILDKTPQKLPPLQALGVLETLINNRKELCELLGAEVEPGEWDGVPQSVFEVDEME